MSVFRSALVLLATFALSLSFAVPGEDSPETLYDESEALPYEITPLFSIMQRESAQALQWALTLAFTSPVNPTLQCDEVLAAQSDQTVRSISGSIIFLDHPLRC